VGGQAPGPGQPRRGDRQLAEGQQREQVHRVAHQHLARAGPGPVVRRQVAVPAGEGGVEGEREQLIPGLQRPAALAHRRQALARRRGPPAHHEGPGQQQVVPGHQRQPAQAGGDRPAQHRLGDRQLAAVQRGQGGQRRRAVRQQHRRARGRHQVRRAHERGKS
jgi:hypothetical protein